MSSSALAQDARPARWSLNPPSTENIGHLARKGATWSILLVVARQPIGLAATSVLSRLLTPDQYGLIGMAAVLTAFLQAFSDMGLSLAAVRREGLTRAQVDNLFWINAAAGVLLWGGCALAGPALSAFFGRDELSGIAAALGATFAIGGLAAQPSALLARQFRSRAIFGVDVTACLAGAVTAVWLARLGYGYWALVGQSLATQLMRLVLVLAATGYRPGLPRSGAGTCGLLAFGGYLTAYALVTYVGRNLDNIVIGRSWGPAALGYYARAYFLMSMPLMLATSALSGVMIPLLSSLEFDRDRLGRAYRQAARAISLIGLPLAAFLLVAAPEVVHLLYGDRWTAVIPLLRWLALAGMAQTLVASSGWLYVSLGHGRALLVVGLALTAVHSSAIIVGNSWGPLGVAIAYTLSSVSLALPTLWIAHRLAGLRLSETLHAVWPVARVTAFAIGAGLIGGEFVSMQTDSRGILLMAKSAAGALALVIGGARLFEDLASGAFAGLRRRTAGGA
ncbi:lipopolysaccharide biosynthesis protein [Isosphaeraceae bacterium EP7]